MVGKGYERLCVRSELETAAYRPPSSSPAMAVFLFRSPGLLNRESGGPASLMRDGSHSSIWNTDFKLWTPISTDMNFLSPGLYNNLTSTYFLRAVQFTLNSTRRQSMPSPDIFDRMHLLFTQVHFFFWQLGRGQYVTFRLFLLTFLWCSFLKIDLVWFYDTLTIAGYYFYTYQQFYF